MLTERQLLKMKEEIDSAKTVVSELNGQLNALLKQLKEDFNCDNISEAEKLLKDMEKDVRELNDQIEHQTKDLEQKYFIG